MKFNFRICEYDICKNPLVMIDGAKRHILNSDGNPIVASFEELLQFWRWFGNSQAVDGSGRPLLLFHGTWDEFENFNVPAYFTDNIGVAESYGEVDSYYLALMNPLLVDYEGESDYSEQDGNDICRDVENARVAGYDSFIAIDTFDGENELDQYVALYPNQIRKVSSFSKS